MIKVNILYGENYFSLVQQYFTIEKRYGIRFCFFTLEKFVEITVIFL